MARFPRHWLAIAIFCSVFICPFSQAQQDAPNRRRVVQRIAPSYPVLARNLALTGSVRVEAVVSPEGNVKTVEIKGGHPVLAQAAVIAVSKWKWEPASRESREPVEVKFSPE